MRARRQSPTTDAVAAPELDERWGQVDPALGEPIALAKSVNDEGGDRLCGTFQHWITRSARARGAVGNPKDTYSDTLYTT